MTTTIDHDIEWALRKPIWDAMVAAGNPYLQPDGVTPSIQFPGEPLDTAPLDRYVRFGFFPVKPVVREVGATPAMTRKGFIRLDTFVRLGIGQDPAIAFTGLIRGVYPYAAILTRNGVEVAVDVIEVKPGSESGVWWMTNVNVYFDVWR